MVNEKLMAASPSLRGIVREPLYGAMNFRVVVSHRYCLKDQAFLTTGGNVGPTQQNRSLNLSKALPSK